MSNRITEEVYRIARNRHGKLVRLPGQCHDRYGQVSVVHQTERHAVDANGNRYTMRVCLRGEERHAVAREWFLGFSVFQDTGEYLDLIASY